MSSLESLRNSPDQLSVLADRIAIDGFASHSAEAVGLANLLACEGFHQPAIDIMRDESLPGIVRARAFGLVHGIALAEPHQLHHVAA